MLSDKYLNSNLKKFGFKTYDNELKHEIQKFMVNFIGNKLKKSGGRIVLPSEYFGHESGSYFKNLSNNGTDMSVTDSMIRPAISTHDITGVITGGSSASFNMPLKSFKLGLSEVNIKLSNEHTHKLKNDFEVLMTKMLKNIAKKKSDNLTLMEVRSEVAKRQYKAFHKN